MTSRELIPPKAKTEKLVATSFRAPPLLIKKLEAIARKQGYSRSEVIVLMLSKYADEMAGQP